MECDENNKVDILQRHKQERKELQNRVQALKKSIGKGDKKRKKEVLDEITKLEQALNERHQNELHMNNPEMINVQMSINENEKEPMEPSVIRVTRAQKRRNKRLQDEHDRNARLMAEPNDEDNSYSNKRSAEMNAISDAIRQCGLELYDIPGDGNCLYCAVEHQLETTGRHLYTIPELRRLTADYIRTNGDEFRPFMCNGDEPVSEKYFDNYCKEIEKSKCWGGQLEIKALSNALSCPIKVIQATGPPTVQGEGFDGPELILTYHRHLYRLGEHYNSTVTIQTQIENEQVVC